MTLDLAGKVVVVTGGASGIGRATAERMAAEGARVVIGDVDVDRGQTVADALGDAAAFVATDVADVAQVEALAATAVDRFGAIDVLVNVAGVSGGLRRFLDDDLRDFERVVAVDLFGVMACSRVVARQMVEQGRGGAIVNIGSGGGITPGVGMLPYRAAKAAVAHFTRCLAVELGEHHIRANCIAPANIATEINAVFDKAAVRRLQPLPHQGHTDDVVEAVLYLAGDRSAHVTGVVLDVDGGMAVGAPPSP